jgi:hypothetical protein
MKYVAVELINLSPDKNELDDIILLMKLKKDLKDKASALDIIPSICAPLKPEFAK